MTVNCGGDSARGVDPKRENRKWITEETGKVLVRQPGGRKGVLKAFLQLLLWLNICFFMFCHQRRLFVHPIRQVNAPLKSCRHGGTGSYRPNKQRDQTEDASGGSVGSGVKNAHDIGKRLFLMKRNGDIYVGFRCWFCPWHLVNTLLIGQVLTHDLSHPGMTRRRYCGAFFYGMWHPLHFQRFGQLDF